MANPEWAPYEITSKMIKAWPKGGQLREMKELYHVAHVSDARRVLEDRVIRSHLVFDESRLNKKRISVVWTSPNTWAWGSMYGNVSFTLPLEKHLEGKRFYWIESMQKYSPTALRILVTEREFLKLDEFDPKIEGGPLHVTDTGVWLRYDSYNYEIMFDEPFSLEDCSKLSFVDHHDKFCNKSGSYCPDRGQNRMDAAVVIMSHILYPSHGSRWSRKRRRELPKAGWRHERNGLIEFGAGARVR
jgi:hypothetical protein